MRAFALPYAIAMLLACAPMAAAQTDAPTDPSTAPTPNTTPTDSGGAVYAEPVPFVTPVVPGLQAVLLPNGFAAAPELAPQPVKDAISAANAIIGKPYVFGGGHNLAFSGRGYDCSGTVSYALHGGTLLTRPLDSGSFLRWGQRGPGAWITIYTNPGHAFVVIAGLRLDTSSAGDPNGTRGPRWRPVLRSTRGFKARHPLGY